MSDITIHVDQDLSGFDDVTVERVGPEDVEAGDRIVSPDNRQYVATVECVSTARRTWVDFEEDNRDSTTVSDEYQLLRIVDEDEDEEDGDEGDEDGDEGDGTSAYTLLAATRIETINGTEVATDYTSRVELNRWTRGDADRLYINNVLGDSELYVDLASGEVVCDLSTYKHDVARDDGRICIRASINYDYYLVLGVGGGRDQNEDNSEEAVLTDGGVDVGADADDRHSTSRADDAEMYIPDDARPLVDISTQPTTALYATDEYIYSTGVHCRGCGCDVARISRASGTTECPNCNWSDAGGETVDWRERARELQAYGGVPERRAQVVALVEAGRTHREVADELGLSNRGHVHTYVTDYRDDVAESRWLAEHGPEV